MPATPADPLAWELYHNSLRTWIVALAVFAVTLAVMLVVRRVLSSRVSQPLARDTIRRTRVFFLVALALGLGSEGLTLSPGWEHAIHGLLTIASVVQVAIWGNGLLAFGLHRYATRRAVSGDVQSPTTLAAFGILLRVVMWIILILIALDNLGVHITTLVAGLGISGVAVALAVQNILGDLFGAISIVLDKPFVVGDAITVDAMTGTVEHIGLKTTRLRSTTGEQLIFANSDLLKSRIRNWKRMSERGVTMISRLGYQNQPHVVAHVPTVIEEVVRATPQVRFVRSHVRALADAAIEVETLYFVLSADYGVFMNAQHAIALGVLQRLADERIAIPTPIQTVVLAGDDATVGADRAPPGRHPRGTT